MIKRILIITLLLFDCFAFFYLGMLTTLGVTGGCIRFDPLHGFPSAMFTACKPVEQGGSRHDR